MKSARLITFTDELLREAFKLSDEKGQDYRRGSDLVHQNFVNVSDNVGVEPIVVLCIYMQKHFDAIRNYIKTGGQSESEPIRERIKDAINYIVLGLPLSQGHRMTQVEFDRHRMEVLQLMGALVQTVDFRVRGTGKAMDILVKDLVSDKPPTSLKIRASHLIGKLIYLLYINE